MNRTHAVIIALIACGALPPAAWGQGDTCYAQGDCRTLGKDPDCIPQDTSLTTPDQSKVVDTGWTATGGPYGIRTTMLVFTSGCGPNLGKDVSDGGASDHVVPPRPLGVTTPKRARDAESAPLLKIEILAGRKEASKEKEAGQAMVLGYQSAWAEVHAVHLVATATVSIEKPAGWQSGGGAIEYFEEGARFRVSARTDPALGLAPDLDAAWDGERYRTLLRGNPAFRERDLFSTQTHTSGQLPTAIANPFGLPLRFLSREGQSCHACQLRLADLHEAAVFVEPLLRTRLLAVTEGEKRRIVLEFPDLGGQSDLAWHVSFDAAGRVSREDMVAADGMVRMTIAFADYRGAGPVAFPNQITETVFDKSGHKAGSIAYQVKEFSVNGPKAPAVFDFTPETVSEGVRLPLHPFQPPTAPTDPCLG